MTSDEISCVAQANAKLPHNAYFAYISTEIIEYHLDEEAKVELTDGRLVKVKDISKHDLTLKFD